MWLILAIILNFNVASTVIAKSKETVTVLSPINVKGIYSSYCLLEEVLIEEEHSKEGNLFKMKCCSNINVYF